MRPAFSVIFLTTLIGLGQGLFLVLFATELFGGHREPMFYVVASAIVLALCLVGLAASFFHLGHPQRAWRAVAMWRTSWLSREAIVLPSFMLAVFAYALAHYGNAGFTPVVGILATVLALALFVCTGMIYAAVKVMQEWASPLTVVNFIFMGLASGTTLAASYAAFAAPDLVGIYANVAIILTVAAFLGRGASLVRNTRIRPKTTIQSAIGMRHPKIAQKSQGAMGGSFNTKEFFHGKSACFMRNIRPFFVLTAFIAPVGLLYLGLSASPLLILAFILQYVGLLAERWYFFAEANHPQNLYYQTIG